MSPEELDAWKTTMRARIQRDRTPAAQTVRRMAADHLDAGRAPAPQPRPVRRPTEREQLLADGFTFSVRDQDHAADAAEHRARRRRADDETQARERVWQRLCDALGRDAADAWLRDAG